MRRSVTPGDAPRGRAGFYPAQPATGAEPGAACSVSRVASAIQLACLLARGTPRAPRAGGWLSGRAPHHPPPPPPGPPAPSPVATGHGSAAQSGAARQTHSAARHQHGSTRVQDSKLADSDSRARLTARCPCRTCSHPQAHSRCHADSRWPGPRALPGVSIRHLRWHGRVCTYLLLERGCPQPSA